MSTDQIQKQILLKAPRDRVWHAITDSKSFGTWFGAEIDGPFIEGEWATGRIAMTQVDAVVAKMQEPAVGMALYMLIETIEPMQRFAFRWHAFPVEPGRDYKQELTTLVTFELGEAEGGTLLVITESGFDQLPPSRREQAFDSNSEGWGHQTRLIEKYLARKEQD
jgi:uncharacterized protein YndB with AHSA1/START domain